MYESNILIKGRHATEMKELVAKWDNNLSQGFFKRNLDVYLVAPIIGKIYGKKAEVDTTVDDSTSIHTEQMNREMDSLEANFRMITLLEKKDTVSIDERTSNAFRYDRDEEKRKPFDDEFEKYVLGGIDILHEKLMKDAKTVDDYVRNLFEFVEDFKEHYQNRFDFDEIQELCKESGK